MRTHSEWITRGCSPKIDLWMFKSREGWTGQYRVYNTGLVSIIAKPVVARANFCLSLMYDITSNEIPNGTYVFLFFLLMFFGLDLSRNALTVVCPLPERYDKIQLIYHLISCLSVVSTRFGIVDYRCRLIYRTSSVVSISVQSHRN